MLTFDTRLFISVVGDGVSERRLGAAAAAVNAESPERFTALDITSPFAA
jgi:hypothetical protein